MTKGTTDDAISAVVVDGGTYLEKESDGSITTNNNTSPRQEQSELSIPFPSVSALENSLQTGEIKKNHSPSPAVFTNTLKEFSRDKLFTGLQPPTGPVYRFPNDFDSPSPPPPQPSTFLKTTWEQEEEENVDDYFKQQPDTPDEENFPKNKKTTGTPYLKSDKLYPSSVSSNSNGNDDLDTAATFIIGPHSGRFTGAGAWWPPFHTYRYPRYYGRPRYAHHRPGHHGGNRYRHPAIIIGRGFGR